MWGSNDSYKGYGTAMRKKRIFKGKGKLGKEFGKNESIKDNEFPRKIIFTGKYYKRYSINLKIK